MNIPLLLTFFILHSIEAIDVNEYLGFCNMEYNGKTACLHKTFWDGRGRDDKLVHVPFVDGEVCYTIKNINKYKNDPEEMHKLVLDRCSFVYGHELYCFSFGAPVDDGFSGLRLYMLQRVGDRLCGKVEKI